MSTPLELEVLGAFLVEDQVPLLSPDILPADHDRIRRTVNPGLASPGSLGTVARAPSAGRAGPSQSSILICNPTASAEPSLCFPSIDAGVITAADTTLSVSGLLLGVRLS